MSVIDEVKQKTDITEIVGQYVTLKKSGRNLSAPCPFHSEKHPSFFVYPEQQSWHCFGACNTGGDVFSFLMKKEGYDFGEALRVLAERAGIELPTYRQDDAKKEEKDLYFKLNEAAAVWFHNNLLNSPAAEKARAYVEKRGYTPETVTNFTLGYSLNEWEALKIYLKDKGHEEKELVTAGLLYENEDGRTTDRFRGKLMIPIRDSRGRVTGFGARVLDDSLPKYVNSPQTPTFDKSGTLYAIDRAAADIRKQDGAVVMEGYMDVITAHQNGVTNTVASMGTAITETQVTILRKLSRNLVLAMDADAAGEEAMLRTVGHENVLGAEIRVVVLPPGKDPDDVIREDVSAWQGLIDNATPLLDFLFKKTTSGLDLTTAQDKSRVAEKLVPILRNLNDTVRQTHYFQQLARMLSVDVNTLMSLRTRQSAPVRRRAPVQPPAAVINDRQLLSNTSDEENALSLLFTGPSLEGITEILSPDAFIGTENRELYRLWIQNEVAGDFGEKVPPSLREQYLRILGRKTPVTQTSLQDKLNDFANRMKKRYLKTLASRLDDIGEANEKEKIVAQIREIEKWEIRKRTALRR